MKRTILLMKNRKTLFRLRSHVSRLTCRFAGLCIILIITFFLFFSSTLKGQNSVFNLIKIQIADTDIIEDIESDPDAISLIRQIRGYDFNFISNIAPGYLWAIVSDKNLIFIEEKGYKFEFIQKGVKNDLHKRIVWGKDKILPTGYHTYDEIVGELFSINRKHPQITELKVIGKTQRFQKNIYALKLSNNQEKRAAKPKILFSAVIHGNEIMGAEICMTLLNNLMANYKNNKQITQFLDSLEIWFLPVINVDGHNIATHSDPLWRKNARDNNGDQNFSATDGVDLNRNFDYNWQTGGTSDLNSRYYRGPYPFSESETRVLAAFVEEQKFLFSVSYHSAEARIYYPWRTGDISNKLFSPEDKLLTKIAQGIAKRIKCINENFTYQAVRNTKSEAYTTNYYYGVLGTIDFMIEVGKYDYVYPKPVLNKIIKHNLAGVFYLLERALGPGLKGTVLNAETGAPVEAEIRILEYDTTDIKPRKNDPKTGRYYRALQPGIYRVLVSAEGKKTVLFSDVIIKDEGWSSLDVLLK